MLLIQEQLRKMNKFFLSHSIYKFTKIDSLSGFISNSFLKKYLLFSSLKSNQLFGYICIRAALFKGWERHLNPLAMKAYEEYYKLAKESNMTMAQLAQAFVNTRPFVTSNIIGATTMEQLKENIDSVNIELSDEILNKIDVIHNNNPNPSP